MKQNGVTLRRQERPTKPETRQKKPECSQEEMTLLTF